MADPIIPPANSNTNTDSFKIGKEPPKVTPSGIGNILEISPAAKATPPAPTPVSSPKTFPIENLKTNTANNPIPKPVMPAPSPSSLKESPSLGNIIGGPTPIPTPPPLPPIPPLKTPSFVHGDVPKKKSGITSIIIVLIVIAALGAGAYFGYPYVKQYLPSKSEPVATPSVTDSDSSTVENTTTTGTDEVTAENEPAATEENNGNGSTALNETKDYDGGGSTGITEDEETTESTQYEKNNEIRNIDIKMLADALETYKEKNNKYPSVSEVLTVLTAEKYMDALPSDPRSGEKDANGELFEYFYATYDQDYVLSYLKETADSETIIEKVSSGEETYENFRDPSKDNVVMIKQPSANTDTGKKPRVKVKKQ